MGRKKKILIDAGLDENKKMNQAKVLAFYSVNGGRITDACTKANVSYETHKKWMRESAVYKRNYLQLRAETHIDQLTEAEDCARTYMSKCLEKMVKGGIEALSKHEVNAMLNESQFIRSTIGKDIYSTKQINEVKVDETGLPTWDDVVMAIESADVTEAVIVQDHDKDTER